MKKISKKLAILTGIIVLLAVVGTALGLNGYFGGGGTILSDTSTRGLVGYWNFDEGTGQTTDDSSGSNNDGTLGATSASASDDPAWTSGKAGNGAALDFDGTNDYVIVADSTSLDITGSITIASWVYQRGVTAFKTVVSKRLSTGATNYALRVGDGGGVEQRLVFYYQAGGIFHQYRSDTDISTNTWSHLAASYTSGDSSSVKIYINGTLVNGTWSSGTGSGLLEANSSSVGIGAITVDATPAEFANARIDDLRIYNRALSAAEVRYLYNRGGPVGHWKFDEGSGTTAYDATNISNDGTITGSTYTTGQYGTALDFDGTDDVATVTNTNPIDFDVGINDAVTFSSWVNADTAGEGATIGRVQSAASDANPSSATFSYTPAEGNLLVATAFERSGTTEANFVICSGSSTCTSSTAGWTKRVGRDTLLTDTNARRTLVIWSKTAGASEDTLITVDNGTANAIRLIIQEFDMGGGTPTFEVKSDNDTGTGSISPLSTGTTASVADGTLLLITAAGWRNESSAPGSIAWTNSIGNSVSSLGGANARSIDSGYLYATTGGAKESSVSWTGAGHEASAAILVFSVSGANLVGRGQIFNKGTNTWLRVDTLSGGRLDVEASLDLATTDATLNISSAIATGSWNHIVMSYTDDADDEITIFINGINVGSSTNGDGAPAADTFDLLIGGRTAFNFDGKIDDARVYQYERTAAEIRADYNEGFAAKFGGSGSPRETVKRGLVGYWNFDEGTGQTTNDSSDSNNDGTRGATSASASDDPAWTSGKAGNGAALDFDGTDDLVNVVDAASLDFGDTADLTITGWFNRDTATTDDVLVAKRNGIAAGDTGYIAYLDDADDKLYFEVSDGVDEYQLASATAFTATAWNHFVIVWDQDSAANTEVYINGIADSATDTGIIGDIGDLSNAVALRVGSESDGANYFDGKLDEPRIYDRALSASEIRYLYNKGGPVGHWKFDEGSGTTAYDATNISADGTLTNMEAATDWVAGQYGTALDFDGTDEYVSIADDADIDFLDTDDMTISGWFNRDTFATDHTVVAKRNGIASTDTGYLTYIDDATDQLIFEVSDGTDEYSLTSSSTFTAAAWNHFSIVWDQDSAANSEIYINGKIDSATDAGTIGDIGSLANSVVLAIGAESDAGLPFDGKIDDIKIYKYSRTAAEIRADYNEGFAAKFGGSGSPRETVKRGLVGYWNFDEGTGQTTDDSSDSNNDGTLGATSASASDDPAWTTGKAGLGGALDFDGTDDQVNLNSLSTGSSFSFVVWIKDGTTSDHIFHSATSFGTERLLLDIDSVSRLRVGNDSGFGVVTIGGLSFSGWHYIAVTVDGGVEGRLYYDGVLIFSDTTPGTTSLTTPAKIGSNFEGNGNFGGTIDEPRIYSRALTAAEIQYLYNKGGPVGHWKFDEGSGTTAYDASNISNDGTITGATYLAGQYGTALDFDGVDDNVNVPDNANLDFGDTTDLTITGWFNRDTATTDDVVVAKRNGIAAADTGYIAYIDATGDNLIFEVSDAVDEYQLTSSSTFTATGWNHFAIVWDQDSAANTEVYINGRADSATDTGTIGNIGSLANAVALRIGTESDGGSPFDGKIDDARVYQYARSASEILADYNAGLSTYFR